MRRFGRQLLAELGLGWRRAIRGPLVIALLGAIGLLIFGLPYRAEEAAARLGYAMSLSWTLTLVCALWCGVASYAYDRERHRMALVFTKPMGRWQLWVGRWIGTSFPFIVVMGAFYGMLLFHHFPDGDHRLQPLFPSLEMLAQQTLEDLRSEGLEIARVEEEQGVSEERLLQDIRRNILRRYTELPEGGSLTYAFEALPEGTKEVSFCLSGIPFMGAYNERMMDVYATYGSTTEQLPVTMTQRGVEARFPQTWVYDGKTPLSLQLVRKATFNEAGYIMFREREDIQLFYTGYSSGLNSFLAVMVMVGVILMAVALGCSLGSLFSLPVGVFVGTLCLLVAAIASLDITVTVTQELQSFWTMISARISHVVAGPFKGIVSLNPLMRLSEGVSIPWVDVGGFFMGTLLPWTVICSLLSLLSSLKDEDR